MAHYELAGRIVAITGSTGGLGNALATELRKRGANLALMDINGDALVTQAASLGGSAVARAYRVDVRDLTTLEAAMDAAAAEFGRLDIVIAGAGLEVMSPMALMRPDEFERTIDINLTSHHSLIRACVPYLTLGLNPAIVVIASKNVPAPGPGAAAYSAAKAGLTQLARVAALELGPKGVRVNVLHPNAVFDTGIWTPDVLENRAKHYKLSVEDYKTNNILHVEVTSKDVANLACAMAGPLFGKTTGAQVAVDGGNDRVI